MISIKSIVKLSILIVVVTVIYSSLNIAQAYAPTLTQEQVYNAQMDHWLDKLSKAESENNPKLDELDVNGKYSRGCLQFQDWTWKHYSSKYGISASQFDCDAEKQVAKKMITDDYNLWRSWWTSCRIKGVGLPPMSSG